MGCCSSFYNRNPQFQHLEAQFTALRLKESEVSKLYTLFQEIDVNGGGTIKVSELLAFLNIERNKFTQRVFAVFDEDGSGKVDFREFTVALWNYCTLGNTTLVLFAFDLYDSDSSGIIDAHEVDTMLKEIYGSKFTKNVHAQRISDKIGALAKMDVTKEVFREFVRKHPALVFPAFDIQIKMQTKCMGKRFWKRITQRRVELADGRFLSIEEIVELMNHQKVEKRIMEEHGGGNINFEEIINEKDIGHRVRRKSAQKDAQRRASADGSATNGEVDAKAATLDVLSATVGTHAKRRASMMGKSPELATGPREERGGSNNTTDAGFAEAAIAVKAAGKLKKKATAETSKVNRRQTFPLAHDERGGDNSVSVESMESSDQCQGDSQTASCPSRRGSASVVGWKKVSSPGGGGDGSDHVGQLQHLSSTRRNSNGSRRMSRSELEIGPGVKYEDLVRQKQLATDDDSKRLLPQHRQDSSSNFEMAVDRKKSRRSSAPLIIPVEKSEFRRQL